MTLTVNLTEKELKELISEGLAKKMRCKVGYISFNYDPGDRSGESSSVSATASVELKPESNLRGASK